MKNYDPTKPSKYIEYFDENILCGWAMSGVIFLMVGLSG